MTIPMVTVGKARLNWSAVEWRMCLGGWPTVSSRRLTGKRAKNGENAVGSGNVSLGDRGYARVGVV